MWSQESWGENFVIWEKNLVHGVVCVVTKNDDRRQFKGWNVANKVHVQCNRNISPNAIIFSYVLFFFKGDVHCCQRGTEGKDWGSANSWKST